MRGYFTSSCRQCACYFAKHKASAELHKMHNSYTLNTQQALSPNPLDLLGVVGSQGHHLHHPRPPLPKEKKHQFVSLHCNTIWHTFFIVFLCWSFKNNFINYFTSISSPSSSSSSNFNRKSKENVLRCWNVLFTLKTAHVDIQRVTGNCLKADLCGIEMKQSLQEEEVLKSTVMTALNNQQNIVTSQTSSSRASPVKYNTAYKETPWTWTLQRYPSKQCSTPCMHAENS